MNTRFRILLSSVLSLISFVSFAQDNSPWKSIASQNVMGVYLAEGCHEYSLTGGQGFSVYIKNTGIQSVNVTGILVAKTVCGTNVTSPFTVNLTPGQIANGSDFDKNGNNGQTSVVTPTDCKGIKYAKLPYSKFINRIKTVVVTNLKVTPIGDSILASQPAIQASVPATETAVTETVKKTAGVYIPTSVPKTIKFDSLSYYRQLLNHNQDSISNLVSNLKSQNSSLLDSLNFAKLNSLKTSATAYANTSTPSMEKTILPKYTFALQAGIGWDKLPMIVNQDSLKPSQSFIGFTSHPVVQVGAVLGLFNNNKVALEVSPFFSYGFNMGSGEKGTHYTYGGKLDVLIALCSHTPLKLVVEGDYIGRNGTWSKNANTSKYEDADYNYGLIRYGLGLRYTDTQGKYWIQPGVFIDAPTTSPVFGQTPYMVVNLEAKVAKKWQISLNYGKSYFAQGNLTSKLIQTNQDYFGARLLYSFRVL